MRIFGILELLNYQIIRHLTSGIHSSEILHIWINVLLDIVILTKTYLSFLFVRNEHFFLN